MGASVKRSDNARWRFGAVVAVLFVTGVLSGFYNSVATSEEDVQSQWGNIRSVSMEQVSSMKKLAKVLETKGYPEKKLVKELNEAGDTLASAEGVEPVRLAGFRADNAIGSVLLSAENYPAIQGEADFINITKDLYEIRRNFSVARDGYNEAVRAHNQKVKFFPYCLLAEWLGLKEKEYFRGAERSRFLPEELYKVGIKR